MLKTLADVGCCGRSSLSILWLRGAVALELFHFVPRFPETLECAAGTPQTHCTCPGVPCPQLCCCCSHSWLSLSGLSWKSFLPLVSPPPKCHKVAVVCLKLSVLLGWRISVDLVGTAGVEVEFGQLCQIVDVPYKQQMWWFLGSLQHLRGVMVLLLTSTLAK